MSEDHSSETDIIVRMCSLNQDAEADKAYVKPRENVCLSQTVFLREDSLMPRIRVG